MSSVVNHGHSLIPGGRKCTWLPVTHPIITVITKWQEQELPMNQQEAIKYTQIETHLSFERHRSGDESVWTATINDTENDLQLRTVQYTVWELLQQSRRIIIYWEGLFMAITHNNTQGYILLSTLRKNQPTAEKEPDDKIRTTSKIPASSVQ